MEILGPNTLRMALDIAIVLAAMSLLVLAAIVAVRLRAQSEAHRVAVLRREAEPLITAYLAGREKPGNVVAALQRDPEHALLLLMEISDRLEPEARTPLRPLFASLPLREKEISALGSRHWERRLQAAERIGYLGDGVSVPALLDALQDPVLAVRFAAARSLAAMGETRTIPQIVLAFDLPGEMNQRRVAETLYDFGAPGTEQLLAVLRNSDGVYSDNGVGVAARVLGMLRAPGAVEPLKAMLGHPDFRARLNAVRALGTIGDHTAAEDVARLANDQAWEVRNTVMQALGKMKSERHIGKLTDALRDESWWVRFSAAQALWELGAAGRQTLTAAMTGDTDRYARDMSRQILEEHGATAPTEAHA
ncbi:MAG: HEAT repeat domain-containing protein [Chthoniobacterales bacterium]